jgi:DNA-binding CsgD family transcriptional regulator
VSAALTATDNVIIGGVSLTQREAQVLRLLASTGARHENIAVSAGCGVATLKQHLRSLHLKTNTTNRTQLALWGADHGCRKKDTK